MRILFNRDPNNFFRRIIPKGNKMVFDDLTHLETIFREKDITSAQKLIAKSPHKQSCKNRSRSFMMLSANRLKHLNKLDKLTTDCIIINLEDGVSPQEKKISRYLAAIFISNLTSCNSKIIVRVNPLDEGGVDDIHLMNSIKPDAIRVAKIKTTRNLFRLIPFKK